jgi:hypothetical protein
MNRSAKGGARSGLERTNSKFQVIDNLLSGEY